MRLTAGLLELVLGILGFVIIAAGLAGTAYRNSRTQANVSSYRDAADAWEKKSNAQAAEIKDLQTTVAALQQDLAAEREARKVLSDVVTGKSAVEALAHEMAAAFAGVVSKTDFMAWQAEIRQALALLNEKLDGCKPA